MRQSPSTGCWRSCGGRGRRQPQRDAGRWGFAFCLLVLGIAAWIVRLIGRSCRDPKLGDRDRHRVPAHVYRRPDPLIYDQRYLQSLGLAVTWDNPDIHLERADRPGVPVDSHDLEPGTRYDVLARIWNGSNYAPAIHMPVRFSYLEFGIGTVKHLIGETSADVPVRGATGCPAFASVAWTTPEQPGHYCLQAELNPPDDPDRIEEENPGNNLAQHNTDVRQLNSPRATFAATVRNATTWLQELRFEVDAYTIPRREPCEPREPEQPDGARDRTQEAREKHAPERHPVPDGWRVHIHPEGVSLEPGEQTDLAIEVVAPSGFEGRQAFNLNAFDRGVLTGGVTLYAEGSADA